eukprot:COSAG02_NODE_674_length_18616_cov_5.948750_1_plen_168_part_00
MCSAAVEEVARAGCRSAHFSLLPRGRPLARARASQDALLNTRLQLAAVRQQPADPQVDLSRSYSPTSQSTSKGWFAWLSPTLSRTLRFDVCIASNCAAQSAIRNPTAAAHGPMYSVYTRSILANAATEHPATRAAHRQMHSATGYQQLLRAAAARARATYTAIYTVL